MDFKFESEMTKPVEDWLINQGLQVKREYPTPWGICDLVGCSLNKTKVRKRLKLGQRQPIGSQFRVLLLSYVPDIDQQEVASFSGLCEHFTSFLDESYLKKELSRLIKDKFVKEVRTGFFQKLNGWVPFHKRIIAVELKLERISKVLTQAKSNLVFADESYVGLPFEKAKVLFSVWREKKLFDKGIGILAVRPKEVKVLLRPRFCDYSDPILKMHCAERFWRTYPKDS